MRRSTDSVIQNPRLLMIIAIGVVIATEGSVNGQLRSAFGPAEADAKRLSGPPAKIGQHLRQVQGQVRAILEETGPGPEIIALSVPRAWRSRADGAIQTYIWLAAVTDNELGALQAEGIVVEAFERRYMKVVQSWLTPTKIERVAEFAFVRRITLPDYAVVRTGSVTSEGDSIHKADLVRGAPQGVDGSGVLVGVISDGVDSRNTAAATGDLPETFPGSGVANIQIDPARPGRRYGDAGDRARLGSRDNPGVLGPKHLGRYGEFHRLASRHRQRGYHR